MLQRAALLVLAVSAFIPAGVEGQTVTGSFQRSLTVTGRPEVDVVTGSGRIVVRPGREGRIEIEGEIRGGDRWGWNRRGRLSAAERVKRLEANPPIQQDGNVVRIGHIDDVDLRDGVSISYTVTLPANSVLQSKTGSGSQQIDGVRGGVQSSTGSGSIVARDIGGRLSAASGSGSITVERVDGPFYATTGSGEIEALTVKGSITAKSGSGSIEVVQAGSGDVDVSSSSGTVKVRGVNGVLRASTTSGGLQVEGDPRGEWDLSASSGSVRVDVPDGKGFELDASTNSGNIDVGMPVTISGKIGRRSVRGSVQGGGPRMHVRTSSGSIDIR